LKPKKLLLADDSVTIQRVIELTFAGEDVQVLTASDGEEALARIAAEKPDVVLADIGMPKRSGYDVSAFIKGQPELSHIPVLLLAGAFESVDDAKAREVQCDGVLVKPFDPQQVIARVRELMSGDIADPCAGVDATQRENAAVPTLDDLLAGVPPGPQAAQVSFDLVARPAVAPSDMTATLTTGTAASRAPASSGRSIIADAFSALVAEQQGEARPVYVASNGSAPFISDQMIDDIARRVIERLALGSSEQMQALVREIVAGVSEKLVREEIDRIRRDAPRS